MKYIRYINKCQIILKDFILQGLYRGYGSTIVREIPFSFIQLPVLEYLKTLYRIHLKNNTNLDPWEVANCGAVAGNRKLLNKICSFYYILIISGGIAAAATTPLDVVKTRIMLADKTLVANGSLKVRNMIKVVYREKGMRG